MTKLSNLFCFIVLLFAAHVRGAAFLEGGGGGGAPNVTIVSPGGNLKSAIESSGNDWAIQLGRGTVTLTTSLLQSNLNRSTTFQGATLANKTNWSLIGVPMVSVIDCRASGPGEGLWVSNCSGVFIEGTTWLFYSNANYAVLPYYSPVTTNNGAYLYHNIAYYKTEKLTWRNNRMIGGTDHGIADMAYGNSGMYAADVASTNAIIFEDSYFGYIGGLRTNSTGITTGFAMDGAAIIPTQAIVRNNFFEYNLRGVELYDDDVGGYATHGSQVYGNTFRNHYDAAILYAGATNASWPNIHNNWIENDASWVWRGTNFGYTSVNNHNGYGMMLNGGRGARVSGNTVKGNWYAGMFIGNSASFCDDAIITENRFIDIDSGSQDFGTGLWVGTIGTGAGDASSVRRAIISRNQAINCRLRGLNISRGVDLTVDGNYTYDSGQYPNNGTTFASMVIGEDGVTAVTRCYLRNNVNVSSFGYVNAGIGIANNVVGLVMEGNVNTGYVYADGITNRSGAVVALTGAPLTLSSAIDFPSVAAAAQFVTNFTFTGTTTNDDISIYAPLAWYQSLGTNFVLRAWGSNGIGFVRAQNVGAAAADPPSTVMTFEARRKAVHGQ